MRDTLEVIAECHYQVKISPLGMISVYETGERPIKIPGCKCFTHVILESSEKQRIHRYYLNHVLISSNDAMPILDLIN